MPSNSAFLFLLVLRGDQMKDEHKSVEQLINETVRHGILDAVGDGISIQDTDFKILYQNKKAKEMIGNHAGEHCYKAYENRDRVCPDCPLSLTFKDGTVRTVERHNPSSNEQLIVEITTSPIKDSAGNIIAGIEVARNITKRKALQEVIEQAKTEWEETFDTIDDAITIHDKEFNIIRANKAAEKILELPFRKLLAQKCYKSYHGTDYPPAACPSCQALKTGKPWTGESFEPHLNKYIEIEALPRYDKDNKIIGVVHVVRDITHRKQIEEKLRTMSITDDLTGLHNRRGFFTMASQQLKIAKRMNRGVLLLSADLDNLKGINDTFGHKEGDDALIKTANILKDTFRESDIIARIGGDEFVVLQTEDSIINADFSTVRLQKNFEKHNAERDNRYKLSVSMGITRYDPASSSSIEELLMKADKLMYEDKQLKQKS
jgi:diguanylate cyclase (GGDEF)-like protein/PAS domain S-box-containing protein